MSIAILIIGCKNDAASLETLSRLSTKGNELIQNYQLDSAKGIIDSLKIIKADTAYINAMVVSLESKKNFIKETQGTYVFSNAGVKVSIQLGENYNAKLSSLFNGQPIDGVNSNGKYKIINETTISVAWEKEAFNATMGNLTYNVNDKTVAIANGTVYKLQTEKSVDKVNDEVDRPAKTKQKKYVMFCGQEYEQGTNFRSSLPSDYQERAGYYCLQNYKEGASSVYYSGFNNAGILVTAVGEMTGERHIILFMCNGSLY